MEFLSEYCYNVCNRKSIGLIVWLSDGEKFEDMFVRFHRTHEHDGQTDTA